MKATRYKGCIGDVDKIFEIAFLVNFTKKKGLESSS